MTLTRRDMMAVAAGLGATAALWSLKSTAATGADGKFAVAYSEDEWKKRLTAEQYRVLRQAGTERPFTSALLHEKRRGRFTCAGCDLPLFASETKYESGTGWPSFWAPLDGAVGGGRDTSYGMERQETHCARCGGHLGHVFEDGPKPTGLRYCMNGVALGFQPATA